MAKNIDAQAIAEALEDGEPSGNGWVACCPAHDDNKASLSITDGDSGKVLVKCHAGCSQEAVITALRAKGLWSGGGGAEKLTAGRDFALKKWHETKPLKGTVAEDYLRKRGIDLPDANMTLRFHPRLLHTGTEKTAWPALVGLVTKGPELLGIIRTFLDEDGTKADVEPAKMMLGPVSGGSVHLREPDKVLLIGEGIETCLSAQQATGHAAWAALSTSGLKGIELPPELREQVKLIVLVDHDEPGEKAAMAVSRRLAKDRWNVHVARVPIDRKGADFNDLLQEQKAEAVKAAINEDAVHVPPPRDYRELVVAVEEFDIKDDKAFKDIIFDIRCIDKEQQMLLLIALKQKMKVTLSWLRELVSGKKAIDHLELAKEVLDIFDQGNLLCTTAGYSTWDEGGIWREVSMPFIRQLVQRIIDQEGGIVITDNLIKGVTGRLSDHLYKKDHQFNLGNPETVNCLNGELELVDGKWLLCEHRRELYRTTQVPIVYDPNAKAPRFLEFLKEVFLLNDDWREMRRAMLEQIGYTLMSSSKYEFFELLLGTGDNGKSVLLAVLFALLGEHNTCSVTPHKLDNAHYLVNLFGKLANIVTELDKREVLPDGVMKAISSGEPITGDGKFKDPLKFRPFATNWFSGNSLPRVRDLSDAVFRRTMAFPFNRKFKDPGEGVEEADVKDRGLKEKLLEELPGILNLSLNAYAKAVKRGVFTNPPSCIEAKKEWRLDNDPVAQFVEEGGIELDRNATTPTLDVFRIYQGYENQMGIKSKDKLTHTALTQRLKELGFKTNHSNRGSIFLGLKLKKEGVPALRRSKLEPVPLEEGEEGKGTIVNFPNK